jgi:RNA polymerase sigma factor (sigma-70 family)
MGATDAELLALYLDGRSQAVFTELVRRHLSLVYHAALRRVGGDRHLAEDVAQGVFADLARKASSLEGRTNLAGWLYTSTRYAAAQTVRTERRRKNREMETHAMNEINAPQACGWDRLGPVIDVAMDELNEDEREIVLLRFFEDRPLAEIGSRFSVSADAARMRIERALEKLRTGLARRGLVSTAAALAEAFAGQSILAAPAGLVARIVGGALSDSGSAAAATSVGWKIKATFAAGVLAVGIVLYEADPGRSAVGLESGPAHFAGESAPPARGAPEEPSAIPAAPAEPTADPAPASASASAAPSEFAGLSGMQQDLLKKLWEIEITHSKEPPIHWGLTMGPLIRQSKTEVEWLRAKGWVAIGQSRGVIFLTAEGAAFCNDHRREIEDHSLVFFAR